MGKKDRRRRRSSSSPPRKKEEKVEKKRRKSSSERPKKEGKEAPEVSDSDVSQTKSVAKLIPAAQVKAKEKEAEALAKASQAQREVPLVVSGCANKTISEIVKGTYFRQGVNHGKPVYKKKPENVPDDDDDLDVLIYYWDERDGDDNCGWWFSPSVGGEMVWAYHPSRKATSPPPAEWNVPHDGPIDKTFTVTAAPQLAKEGLKIQKKEELREKKDEDDDDEEEEEEEEDEEEDEEVSRPKAAALAKDDGSSESPRPPKKDSKDLTAEERELEMQEAEDRRLMEQLRQREEARKKKAEELRMRKEQEKAEKAPEKERIVDDKEEKKKKKQKEKDQKKKDKEEKRKREEEEERERLRRDREREEEDRRRKEEDEKRRRREEEEERRRKKDEEERRERAERARRKEKEEEERRERAERLRKEKEEEDRRRKREEERREEEEREERRRKQEEERRRRREEEDRRRKEEEEAERRREEERRRKREEEEEEERKRRRLIEEKEEAERARRKEIERQKKEEERRKHEEKMQRKLEERRRRETGDRGDRGDRDRDRSDRGDRGDRGDRDRGDRDRGRDRERPDMSESQPRDVRKEKEKPEDKQQKAVQAVVSCFHRMSGVNMANFDSLKADFERIMASELPYTGEKETTLREEASRVLASAEDAVAKEKVAREEELKRREEEEKVRLEQEAKAKRQMAANSNVLKALQKLSDATPVNWAQMSLEFQEIMRTELPDTGDQREALQAEADRVFNYAQQYVKQMEERQKEQEEQERIRREELKVKEQNARSVVAEVETSLGKAEEEAQKARSATEQLYQLSTSAKATSRDALVASFPKGAEESLRHSRVCGRLGTLAQQAAETSWKFLEQHRMTLLEVETLRPEMLAFVQRSEARLQGCQMAAQAAVKLASETRERIQNNAAPMLWDRKSGDVFRSYDQDEDGFLSRNEVLNFARLEYGFAIPSASLDRIFQQLVTAGAPGLEPARFQQLRTALGIARFESRSKARKGALPEGAAESNSKVEAEYQEYLKQRFRSVSAEVEAIAWSDLEKKVTEVEAASASFVKASSPDVGQEELQRCEASLDAALTAAKNALPGFLSHLRTLRHSTMQLVMVQPKAKQEPTIEKKEEDKPQADEKKEDPKENKEAEEMKESKESKDSGDSKDEPKEKADSEAARGLAELKELQEKLRQLSLRLAKLEARIVLAERRAAEGRKVTAHIAALKVEEVRVEVAMKLRQCIEQLGGKAVDLFQIIAKGEDAASVEEAHAFLKENNCDVEVDKLARAFAACKTSQEGGVKVSREEFARIIRVVYEVAREVGLTESLAIGPPMRLLEVGELLEVHAGPRAEPSPEGLQRIHARALRDGVMGWVTLLSSEGPYLVRSKASQM